LLNRPRPIRPTRRRAIVAALLAVAAVACPAPAQQPATYDVVVYGGTSAGVAAAVQAARMGKKVVLIEPTAHLGGLSSGGLGFTDLGNPNVVGGISREFYHRLYLHYQQDAAWNHQAKASFEKTGGQGVRAMDAERQLMWTFEPSVAEKVFDDLVKEANVPVVRKARLDLKNGVTKSGARIESIRTEDGKTYAAKAFIDATYEGDLMAKAGVKYTLGREANSQYGETINGIQAKRSTKNQLPTGIDPYKTKGDPKSGLLPGVNPDPGGADGSADAKLQAYCYRMCLTDVPANRVMIEKPANYNEVDYEILFRACEVGQKDAFFKVDLMPNRKTDSNNASGISTDFIGQNYNYPEADYATRDQINKAHENWQRGLVWTVQNHPRIPKAVRDRYAKWGLPKDEFTDNGHWATQLYIREARRMVGDFVQTEKNLRDDHTIEQSIGMGSYNMDSHNAQRYVDESGHVRNEGDVQIGVPRPYRIDYRAIVPRQAECENLLVPVCLSATHIAFGSIRMEPVFMILGQSAATAACIAADEGTSVQRVSYDKLRERLEADKQVLSYAPSQKREK
jgi:ribulose 1,5-bisphosphate synthetase/thiazole synthase